MRSILITAVIAAFLGLLSDEFGEHFDLFFEIVDPSPDHGGQRQGRQ